MSGPGRTASTDARRTAQEGQDGGGSGGIADGVSIDGLGTALDPFAAIPGYFVGLLGFTRETVDNNEQDHDFIFAGESVSALEVVGYVPNNNAAASTLTLQPNNLTTNQANQEVGAAGAIPSGSASANLEVAFAPAAGFTIFRFILFTQTGMMRFFFGNYLYITSAAAITGHQVTGGRWNDIITPITSARLHSDRVDGIKAGSVFFWRTIGVI